MNGHGTAPAVLAESGPASADAARRLAVWPLFAVSGAVFLLLLWANLHTPLWADDWCRAIPLSLAEPFALAWREYLEWSGRFFVLAATYLALALSRAWSEAIFDALNAFVFVALVRNIVALAAPAGRIPPPPSFGEGRASEGLGRPPLAAAADFAFAALAVWWLPRAIGEAALWKTGAINYLWAAALEAWVVRLALAPAPDEAGSSSRSWRGFWAPPLAFLAATFLEPLSVLTTGVLFTLCALRLRRGRPAPQWLAGAHAAGTLFLLLAPGNFVRAGTLAPSPPLDRIVGVVGNLGALFDPYWIGALCLVALAYAGARGGMENEASNGPERPGREQPFSVRLRLVLVAGRAWVFVALAAAYMGLFLVLPRPSLAARVSFPASLLLVCYLVALFMRRPLTEGAPWRGWAMVAALLAAYALTAAAVAPSLVRLERIARAWEADPVLRAGPGAAVTLPLVRVDGRLTVARKHVGYAGLTPDPSYYINVCFARAMGVASVIAR